MECPTQGRSASSSSDISVFFRLCALLNIAVASDEITLYTCRGRYSASQPIILSPLL